jgi:hypothetical protein
VGITYLHTGHLQVPLSQFSCRYDSRSKHCRSQRQTDNRRVNQDYQKLPYYTLGTLKKTSLSRWKEGGAKFTPPLGCSQGKSIMLSPRYLYQESLTSAFHAPNDPMPMSFEEPSWSSLPAGSHCFLCYKASSRVDSGHHPFSPGTQDKSDQVHDPIIWQAREGVLSTMWPSG